MRIGQLVGFAEKRFSFDLVSRKKPVAEPVQTESVEPFESLILRRMPPESEYVDDVAETDEPTELHTAQTKMDAPEDPVLVISPPPALQVQMPAPSAQDDLIGANVVSPEAVMAALTRVNTAPADRAETMKAPAVVVPAPPVAVVRFFRRASGTCRRRHASGSSTCGRSCHGTARS